MKHLYHPFLNLRVWLLRRRLRQMGFREIAEQVSVETLMRMEKGASREFNHTFRWLQILLTIEVVLLLSLHFWLRSLEPVPITVPPPEKAHSSPALPDAIMPLHRNFGEPTLHLRAA
jgi:hypothetical protein